MQHATAQLKKSVTPNTVILCSFFVTFGIGMISYAWLELHQLQIENQKLKIDLILIEKKHTLERQQMEEKNGRLQLENQMLKKENATLWLDRKRLEDFVFHLQSELSLVQENYTHLAEDYKRATTENEHLLLNLSICQTDKTEMPYRMRKLHLQLNETAANNSRLGEELEEARVTRETLVGPNQRAAHENRLLHMNTSLALQTNAELSRQNVFLQSNLTSCQSSVQKKENDKENLQGEINETHANNTWLQEELPAERLKVVTLAEENNLLKVNLTSALNVGTNLSAVNSILWSYLKVCRAEKQQTTDENGILRFRLNETLLNITLLSKVLTENRLLSQTLAADQQSLESWNRLLQLNLSLAQSKSAKLHAEQVSYSSDLTSCQSATQELETRNRNLKLELNETQENYVSTRQMLESERSVMRSLSEQKLQLQQTLNANVSAENSLLQSYLGECQSEKQTEQERNSELQLELNQTHAERTLLRESLAHERLLYKTLTADKLLLEENKQLLWFHISLVQNWSTTLFAVKATLFTNLENCETENQGKEEENRNVHSKLTEAQANNTWLRNKYANESLASETLSEENQHLRSNLSLHHRIRGTLSAEYISLLENLTSSQLEKLHKEAENEDLELELNKSQSNNTLLRVELANERLLSETLKAKTQLLKNTTQHLLLNLSLAQWKNANVSAENSFLLSNLTSCQSDRQEDDENVNLQASISEMQAKNTLLKTQLANERLVSKALFEKTQLLQANLTLFQNLSADASAENSSLQSSLTSCQVNKTKTEEETRDLQVKLDETITNTILLETQLYNASLVTELWSAEMKLLEDENQLLLSNLSSAEDMRASLLAKNHLYRSNLTLCHMAKQDQINDGVELESRLEETSSWLGDELAQEKLALETVREETQDLEAKTRIFLDQNKNLSTEHTVLQLKLLYCETSKRMLEESLEEGKVDKEHLHQNLTSCQAEVRQMETERIHLYSPLNNTNANITSLNQELARVRLKIEPLNVKRQLLNGSLAILEENLAVARARQSSIALCQKKQLKLLEENQQMNAEVDQLQWNITSLNSSAQVLEEELRTLTEEINSTAPTLASETTRNKMVRSVLRSPSLEIDGYCDMDTLRCSNCRKGWEEHNSRCFQMSIQVLTWLGARADCIDKGGDLAVVKSEQDQVFLTHLVAQLNHSIPGVIFPAAWIGLDDMREENQFTWVYDGKAPLTYWSGANPDNATEHFDLIDKSEGVIHPQGQDCVVIEHNTTLENESLMNWDDISCRNKRHFICEADILGVDRAVVPLRV